MNLSEMTKTELIELIQHLQFSLKESHKVIQQLAKDLPEFRKAKDSEARDNDSVREQLTTTQELEKYDIYKLYDYIIAADTFNGEDDAIAKQKAFHTIYEVLAIEGVAIEKDSLSKYFPANTKS